MEGSALGPTPNPLRWMQGPGVVRVVITDVLGNTRIAFSDYVLQDISFTATLLSPDVAFNELEGTAVTFASTFAHSLVPSTIDESDLTVRYISSVQGVLAEDVTGTTLFGVNDTPIISSLVSGDHTITVRISDGSSFAEDERLITIRNPGITGTLIQPQGETTYFTGAPGDLVDLQASTTNDPEVSPLYTWYIDGAEFDSTWGTYGSDPTDKNREVPNLGNYDPAVAPFNDQAWQEGSHILEFFARLPSVDTDFPGLGCVTIPGKAVCLQVRINLAPPATDICPVDDTPIIIGSGQNEVWEGVRRLNCDVSVEAGGTLDVLPGARISVKGHQQITLVEGSITMGRPGASDIVLFEAQSSIDDPNQWEGIKMLPTSTVSNAVLTIDNVTFRHTDVGIHTSTNTLWGGINHRAEIQDFVNENTNWGIADFCPQVLRNATFTDVTNVALLEGDRGRACGVARTYDNIQIDGSMDGISVVALGGEVTITNSSFRNISHRAVQFEFFNERVNLTVTDSNFDNVGWAGNEQALYISDSDCPKVTLLRNRFTNNREALRYQSCSDEPVPGNRVEAFGNIFVDNGTAVYDSTTSTMGLDLHLNSFTNNGTTIWLEGNTGADLNLQGNHLGSTPSTPGGAAAALPVGILGALPGFVNDFLSNSSRERVIRFGNTLPTAIDDPNDFPVAFIREPLRTGRYNADRCLPLEAESPLAAASLGTCRWWMDGEPNVGTELTVDADGCAVEAVADGIHTLVLECERLDGVGGVIQLDRHDTSFLVDNAGQGGVQRRPSVTWSATDTDLLLTSDYTVPVGHTLVIEPGATVRMAAFDNLRQERYPDHGSNQGTSNTGFGARTLVDLYVDGFVQMVGASGSPIRAEAESGTVLEDLWGGFRVSLSGQLTVQHVEMAGANRAIHGEYDPDNPFNPPVFSLQDSLFEGTQQIVRGVCPTSFSNITAQDVGWIIVDGHCPSSLVIQDSNFQNIGGTNPSSSSGRIQIHEYNPPIGPIDLTIRDTIFNRGFGQKRGLGVHADGSTINLLTIERSTFTEFRNVFQLEGPNDNGVIVVNDSTFENFEFLQEGPTANGQLLIDRSTFTDGTYIFWRGTITALETSLTNSRITDVQFPMFEPRLGSEIVTLTVSGNEFINSEVVFNFQLQGGAASSADFSNNNYIGTTNLIMNLNEQGLVGCLNDGSTAAYCTSDNGATVSIDMSNSHFGVATQPEIDALLDEPPPGLIPGRVVDTTGFSATPISLPGLP